MMKITRMVCVLMGTMLMAAACSSDMGIEQEKELIVEPPLSSTLVSVYSDKDGTKESLLAGNVLVTQEERTLMLNVPAACRRVYMKYTTVLGEEVTKELAFSSVARGGGSVQEFDYGTTRLAAVTLKLPEDAVQPTEETDGGYLFYHNTGVAMFEDGWPTPPESWYDEDFNDVVVEYDFKVTECQDAEQMAAQGSKEELLLTLDVRAVGGTIPIRLGVVLEGLDDRYIDRITASLVLKAGQGVMTDLNKEELSTSSKVVVNVPAWKWNTDPATAGRFAVLTVDKAPQEGTVVTLDGLSSLKDNNADMFQVVPGRIKVGLPMLRAEVRLIGKEGLTGADREAQLEAFRDLILDTKRQNFFIVVNGGNEIHMKGYAPTSVFRAKYDELVAADSSLDTAYSNADGYTWGIKMPVGAHHANEYIPFKEAYPQFMQWLNSYGADNAGWYENYDPGKTVKYW